MWHHGSHCLKQKKFSPLGNEFPCHAKILHNIPLFHKHGGCEKPL